MATTLPSSEDCTNALAPLPSADPAALTDWRNICHRCLKFACERGDGGDDSHERADAAVELLSQALQSYFGNVEKSDAAENDAVTCTLVESIWLMDCLLADDNKTNLVHFVKCLAAKTIQQTAEEQAQDAAAADEMETDDKASDKTTKPLIPPPLFQTSLEFPLLKQCNLLPHATAAIQKSAQAQSVKTKTKVDAELLGAKQKFMKVNANLYYRQNKFNLCVEESEGFAKLISYLVGSTSGAAGSNSQNGDNAENNGGNSPKDVRALIGAFDLDPNRVLDLTLDALEWELKSIVDKYSKSEWRVESIQGAIQNCKATKIDALLPIIRELDGSSPRAVAHLLGFKYRYYARGKDKKSAADSASNTYAAASSGQYPNSLYLSTAFLSAKNILDAHDLLPHLLDKNQHNLMELYQAYTTETVSRLKKMGVISLNSKNSKEETKAEERVDPFLNDPTIGIFRYMLAVGKWDDAVAFLANASVEEFKDAVCNEDVEKLEKTMKTAVLAASSLSDSVAEAVCGWVAGVIEDVYKEARNGALVSKDTSVCDISNVLLDPLTSLVGSGKIRLNQSLYKKLCGLYRTKLTSMKQSENKELDESSIDLETFAVLSTFLVPSISLFPPNPDLSRELWSVLQLLPHSIRYKLYSAWRSPALEKGVLRCMLPKDIKAGNFPKPLDCIESEIKTALDAKSIMKRISKENIEDKVVPGKPTEPGKGRELSGISHNNPLVVFSYILNQIESYDNMILLMVDTFQFVTALGLDVIGYCLLLSLGGGDDGKNRTKTIGLNTEQWLTSLETFTGAFYKKFPDVELRGLLSYITQRLKEGHATELGVLRSLIKTAGGYGFVDYDSTSALSELQLDGRCGSRLLKLETSSFGVIDHVNPRASWMLRSVLQGQDLGIIILILLSQIRQNVLYSKSESKAHVKVMGRLYDNCESVLCLLLEYVSDSSQDPPEGPSTKEKFANSLPPLNDLCDKYGLDTSTAWMLIRPLFRKSMFYKDDKKLAGKSSADEPPAFLKPFSPTPEMTSSYQKLLPEPAWKHLSTNLFETFFSLAIYDLQCPSERYSIEISRLNKEVERLTQLQQGRGVSALAAAAAAAGGNERQIREATRFTEEHKKELNRLKFNVEKLSNDFSRQKKRCELVHAKIEAQKDEMFQSNAEGAGAIDEGAALAFLTFCIYPRFLSSPEDALFCAHFVKLMHKMKIPGLSVVELIDGIVNAITGSLYCITEDEAGNAAIFLNEIWKSANSWRYDNDSFATELKGTPGSRLSKAFSQEQEIGDHAVTDGITHDDYKTIFSQWHLKIGSAAVGCLNSSEYMHTRSALIVLSRIVLVYPTQPKVGDKFLEILAGLQADESRPDIRATAQGYASQLSKARDEGMWKEENIAVTKARQEKEQMKAEERKKKLAEQHEAIRKETEKINSQIGDGRNDNRDWRQGGGRHDERGRPWPVNQGPPLNTAAPVFVPRDGGPPREQHAAQQRRDGHDHSRGDRRDGMWERDRAGAQPSRHNDRGHTHSSRPSSSHGGPDGHDRRYGDDAGRRKRSRSPEPGEDTERDISKRFKPAARTSSSPPRSGGHSNRDRRSDRKTRSSRH